MSEKSIVEKLKEYNDVSSWLLWGEKFKLNEATREYEFNAGDISTRYVFVGLNPSGEEEDGKSDDQLIIKWGSFHTDSRGDKRLRTVFQNNKEYEGSYITDLIKYKSFYEDENPKEVFKEKGSAIVVSYLADNHDIYNRNIRIFEEELKSFGRDKPTVLAFGNEVYKMLKFNPNINNEYKIIKLTHFSFVCNDSRYINDYVNKELSRHELPTI